MRYEPDEPIVFDDLDPIVQKFFRDARSEDIRYLRLIIDQQKSLEVIRKFMKWLFYAIVGGLTLAASFGDSVMKLYQLWKGAN